MLSVTEIMRRALLLDLLEVIEPTPENERLILDIKDHLAVILDLQRGDGASKHGEQN